MKTLKNFKRLIAAIMCLCLVLTAVGCGDKTAKGDEVPVVKWLIRCDQPKEIEPVLEKVNEILVEKVGAKLSLEFIDSGAYQDKMNTFMASSKYYDLAFAGAGNPLYNAASKGGVVSLDKYLEEVPELKASIPDWAWELVKYEGEIYGVPNMQVMPVAMAALLNNDYWKKYGGDASEIKSIDDLVPYMEAVKNNEKSGVVFALAPTRNEQTLEALDYCKDYAKMDNIYFKQADDGTWKATYKYEVPEYKKQVERMNEFYKLGYIDPDIVSSEGSTGRKSGITFAVYKPGLETEYKVQGHDLSVALIQTPVVDRCNALTVVGKDAKYPVEALKILQEVNTNKELYNLLTLGIEGVHYEKVDENTFRYIGDNQTNTYWINGGWRFGCQYNEYVKEGADPDVWEQTKVYNDTAVKSPFMGFAIEDKAIRTELTQIQTVISRYSAMNVGAIDPADYYDKFLAELKAAGSDKVAAEYERQINEFMAAKK